MSIYRSGVEAYRDTTKWLAAFVPITALAAAGVVLGNRLLARSADGNLAASGWLLVALAAAVGAVVAILWAASGVLSVEGTEVGELVAGQGETKKELVEAFGAGLGLPYFADHSEFAAVVAKRPGLTDAELAAAAATVDAIREWSVFREVKARFRRFVWVFAGAIGVLGGAGVVAVAGLGGAPSIDTPTAVTVSVPDAGAAAFASATGCTDAGATSWMAVGGTLTTPVLDPAGPGCRAGATWTPAHGQAEVAYLPG